jgi:hypothetical protein
VKVTLGGICEQDLDFFFLEEVLVNSSFRTWLLSKVPGWPTTFSDLAYAGRSIQHPNGELDLMFTFQDLAGDQACLLMENKINAGYQRDQLLRYQRRASELLVSGGFGHVAVALLAPRAYASGSSGKVDAMISYEDVEGWLSSQVPDERTSYKLCFVRTALEKHASGYNPDSDQPVTDFWQAYWREARSRAPELEMRNPATKPAGAGFVWFSCSDLPGDLKICHKLSKGHVDLHFPGLGNRVAQLRVALAEVIEPDMEVAPATASAAVRLVVPPLKTGLPFAGQEEDVRQGIDAASTLRAWARRNSAYLIEAARSLSESST